MLSFITYLIRFCSNSRCQPIIQLLYRDVQQFRGGLVVKAHRLCVSRNSRLESSKEEEEEEEVVVDYTCVLHRLSGSVETVEKTLLLLLYYSQA